MSKKILYYLTLLCLPLLFTNCSKDDEKVSLETKTAFLSDNTWVISEVVSHQKLSVSAMGTEMKIDTTINALANMAECEYDADYNFLATGIIQYTLSETYCGQEINGNFTWELNDAGSEMSIAGDEGALFIQTSTGTITEDEVVMEVLELNADILKLKFEIPYETLLGNYMDPEMLDLYEQMGLDYEFSGTGDVVYTFTSKKE